MGRQLGFPSVQGLMRTRTVPTAHCVGLVLGIWSRGLQTVPATEMTLSQGSVLQGGGHLSGAIKICQRMRRAYCLAERNPGVDRGTQYDHSPKQGPLESTYFL